MVEIVLNVKTGERMDIMVILEFVKSLKDKIAIVVVPYKFKSQESVGNGRRSSSYGVEFLVREDRTSL